MESAVAGMTGNAKASGTTGCPVEIWNWALLAAAAGNFKTAKPTKNVLGRMNIGSFDSSKFGCPSYFAGRKTCHSQKSTFSFVFHCRLFDINLGFLTLTQADRISTSKGSSLIFINQKYFRASKKCLVKFSFSLAFNRICWDLSYSEHLRQPSTDVFCFIFSSYHTLNIF